MDYKGLDAQSHKKNRRKKENNTKDAAQETNKSVVRREGDRTIGPSLTTEANTIPQAEILLTAMDTSEYGKAPHRIIENIPVNCIELNDPLGRSGLRSKQANMTTKVEEIQSVVNGIIKLQYPDAVQLIKQENAFSASRSIQSRLSETVYWEMRKCGPRLLQLELYSFPPSILYDLAHFNFGGSKRNLNNSSAFNQIHFVGIFVYMIKRWVTRSTINEHYQ